MQLLAGKPLFFFLQVILIVIFLADCHFAIFIINSIAGCQFCQFDYQFYCWLSFCHLGRKATVLLSSGHFDHQVTLVFKFEQFCIYKQNLDFNRHLDFQFSDIKTFQKTKYQSMFNL